ncbi:hypothetical protein [Chlorobium sp. KB01]|uniref:adenosine deaminase family protein n=1 Tax=Chlorobium sp. KB01 TaxID=1917528 RepID=UPI000975B5CF|nr:hypothetical protein [Chlorobium sp. KB01]
MHRKSAPLIMLWMLLLPFATLHARPKDSGPYSATRAYYQRLIAPAKPDIAGLRLFFTLMPKGGDIHQHFTGSLYAENYLEWIQREGCWISKSDYSVITPKDTDRLKDTVSVKNLRSDRAMSSDFFTHWSDKDYANHYHDQLPPDAQFFNTFIYFSKIFGTNRNYYREGLLKLKERAKNENVQYLETMFVSPGYQKSDPAFDSQVRSGVINIDNKQFRTLLDSFLLGVTRDTLFYDKVHQYRELVESSRKRVDDESFTLRFQSYVSRNSAPSVFFSGLYTAFYEADKNNGVVGVNIVSAENDPVALGDYRLHMQMFRYMKEKYPHIRTSMHAGELASGMVPPEEMKYHIAEAVSVAGAGRIGHGVDIAYETGALSTLIRMKEERIPVEINLTSNEFILGVKNEAHPIRLYTGSGVPVVISSDDPGVSRNSLTEEYVLLASRYRYSYDEVKQFAANSIIYSFLKKDEKERALQLLQKKFTEFEGRIADFARRN